MLQIDEVFEPGASYSAHNHEMNLAWQFIASTGVSVFLTGKAGTGKTTFLKKLRELMPKRMVVLAPTGVAAINAGGQTIHSFFQLPFGPFIPGEKKDDNQRYRMNEKKKALIRTLDLLVIDEISMVRADLLDQIDDTLRKYRDRYKPFGGVQLLLIGDLMQLSPVAKDSEWSLLGNYYETPYFFSSRALQQTRYVTVELTHIYRQQDLTFINLLGKVRNGYIDQEVMEALNKRHIPGYMPETDGWIRLTTHNATANDYNRQRLDRLNTEQIILEATIQGEFPEMNYPTDARLVLKKGAQVMFVKNDPSIMHAYYNGKIGIVGDMTPDGLEVFCNDGRELIHVTPVIWENTKYTLNPDSKEIEEKVEGTFTQYPLRLAWAITVHKSQGLTFDHAVLDINSSFAHGQVYVALSRCRSLEGLVLSNPIYPGSIKTDRSVNAFIDREISNIPNNVQMLPQYKYEYVIHLLDELYSFRNLNDSFNYFTRIVDEHLSVNYATLLRDMKTAVPAFEAQVKTVAERFKGVYYSLMQQSAGVLKDSPLLGRIKDSSKYFLDKLHEIFDPILEQVSIRIDNKQVAERYNNALNAFKTDFAVKCGTFDKLTQEDFSVSRYLQIKAVVMLDGELKTHQKAKKQAKSNAKAREKELARQAAKEARETKKKEREVKKAEEREAKKAKAPKIKTHEISYNLYKEGLTIEQIAEKRGFATTTIMGHLAKYVALGKLNADDFVSPERRKVIRDVIESLDGGYTLTQVKEKLPEDYTFGEIHFTIATM